jgi:hypothetical protein
MLKGFVRLPAEVILIPYEAYLVIRDRRIITYRGLSFTHKQKKTQWKAEAAFHLYITLMPFRVKQRDSSTTIRGILGQEKMDEKKEHTMIDYCGCESDSAILSLPNSLSFY